MFTSALAINHVACRIVTYNRPTTKTTCLSQARERTSLAPFAVHRNICLVTKSRMQQAGDNPPEASSLKRQRKLPITTPISPVLRDTTLSSADKNTVVGKKEGTYHVSDEMVSTTTTSINSFDSESNQHKFAKEGETQKKSLRSTANDQLEPPFLFAGLLAAIFGSVCFSLSVLCVKLLPNQDGSLTQTVKPILARGIVISICCAIALKLSKTTFVVRRDELWVNVGRCLFGSTNIVFSYYSLNFIGMGDSTALVFSSPIWTSLLSRYVFGEPLSWLFIVALPISMVGIVLIAHPSLLINIHHENLTTPALIGTGGYNSSIGALADSTFEYATANISSVLNSSIELLNNEDDNSDDNELHERRRLIGVCIALFSSTLVSATYICCKLRKKTAVQTTTFWLGLSCCVVSLSILSITGFGRWPEGPFEWSLLLANGVLSWFGQTAIQWAFNFEGASVMALLRTLDVALTFIFSALFLQEVILWTSVLGATILVTVVILLMLNNWIQTQISSRKSAKESNSNNEEERVEKL